MSWQQIPNMTQHRGNLNDLTPKKTTVYFVTLGTFTVFLVKYEGASKVPRSNVPKETNQNVGR